MIGLVLGTAMYEPLVASQWSCQPVRTPYGRADVSFPLLDGVPVPTVLRHGIGHTVVPGDINYRANLWALRALGVSHVIATNVCGAIDNRYRVGDLATPTDFVDLSAGRATDLVDEPRPYADMHEPYSREVGNLLRGCAADQGVPIYPSATYVCTSGPRFESPAEIEMMRRGGGHLVGMTGATEVILARRLGLHYGSVAVVSNPAAGRSAERIDSAVVNEVARRARPAVFRVLVTAATAYRREERSADHRPAPVPDLATLAGPPAVDLPPADRPVTS